MKTNRLFTSLGLGLGLTVTLLWLLSGVIRADVTPTHYVAPTGSDSGDCSNSASPCRSAQYAVDQAGNGDTVKIASGVYTGVGAAVITISKNITLSGAYVAPDWGSAVPETAPSVLDGQKTRRVIYIAKNLTVTLEGLQIVNGAPPSDYGGGVYKEQYDTHGRLTIRNCDILSNTSAANGGGVYIHYGVLILQDSSIVSNTASGGGGVYAREAVVTMTHNLLQDNMGGDGWGSGGADLYECASYAAHNTFINNAAGHTGGGFGATRGDLILTHNTFQGNAGGGLDVEGTIGHTYTIAYNLIQSNTGGGARIHSGGDGWIVFSHNQVLNNIGSETSKGNGGGVYVYGPALVSNNLIQDNWATTHRPYASGRGGGLSLKGPNVQVEGNRILNNHASSYGGFNYTVVAYGGGVFIDIQSHVTMTNNIIAGNQACDECESWRTYTHRGGGAIFIGHQSTPSFTTLRLYHNTIANNESPAILNESSGITMSHNILSDHTVHLKNILDTSEAGGSLPPVTIADYTLWHTSMDVEIESGTFAHTNDFTGDPDFISGSLDNYHLGDSSEAIDKGTGVGITNDIDNNPRPIGASYDLGADEYTDVDLSSSQKRAAPSQAAFGDTITFTITLHNSGSANSGGSALFDAIPASTAYVSGSVRASSGSASYADGIKWAGDIAPGQSVAITFQVTVTQAGFVENRAVLTDGYGTAAELTAWVNAQAIYLPVVLKN